MYAIRSYYGDGEVHVDLGGSLGPGPGGGQVLDVAGTAVANADLHGIVKIDGAKSYNFG